MTLQHPSEKQWFVMRDLKRRNANQLAVHELTADGIECFTPMTQMIMVIGGKKQRRDVPVIQDLLFVHESKEILDGYVARIPTLQYRFRKGHGKDNAMVVRNEEMERFILAISNTPNPMFLQPEELTRSMIGREVRIVGGILSGFEGRLLSIKGMRKRRIIVGLEHYILAAVEVQPEFIQLL